ncbi:s-layer-like protein [Heliomicrobium modesticaldum Ice1]|uniref:S-layer-like protein n=1 Tax=Heliobacterium modesticaldum (strain ATCC 51547 / Ice1) TaxID=498761 RepID=B0THL6_HELMI|nr:S-layer homology domain-containing protein [Heliomicrobium modesticaldum]ABZ83454.1 s-layer-like protein [Heliomicrobium modesticaldum Ice1]
MGKLSRCIGSAMILLGFTASILVSPSTARAESSNLTIEGGVSNEYDYSEYVFVTGEPILMKGTFKVTVSAGRGDTTTTKITYTLADDTGKNKLSRSTTFVEMSANREDKNQVVRTSQVDKFSESIQIDGVKYKLEDYRLNKSTLMDRHPVVDYYSGNWEGRKIYSVNKTAGRLTVDISGNTVGYDHNWGRSETQRMTQILQYSPGSSSTAAASGPDLTRSWDGQVDFTINLSTDRNLSYQYNDPVNISFDGGYLIHEQGSSTIIAKYDLPYRWNNSDRDRGEKQWSWLTTPKVHRMFVPNYEDIRNHWAERDIQRLAGVKAWEMQQGYFGPSQPITRLDFARAFVQTLGVISPDGPQGMIAYTAGYPNLPPPGEKATAKKPTASMNTSAYNGATGTPRSRTKTAPPPSPFADITPTASGYDEVKLAVEKGILTGVSSTRFDPYGLLTREQAATAIVRGLGLATLAPSGAPPLPFYDDRDISPWARDSIYVAQELGIISGDAYGYFRPGETLTRAEAAAMLVRAVDFLQHTMKQDYRDRLLNMN